MQKPLLLPYSSQWLRSGVMRGIMLRQSEQRRYEPEISLKEELSLPPKRSVRQGIISSEISLISLKFNKRIVGKIQNKRKAFCMR
jgi:hypothetical protein